MFLIEPCCVKKHLRELRDTIARGGTRQFEGYGDLSLAELLPAVLTRYSETDLLIAAPSLPDQAADAILSWMKKTWARMDGRGNLWRVRHLAVIADLSEQRSPAASQWLKDNPLGERLTLIDTAQDDTAILLPDFAITGPVNMRYGNPFTATATTEQERVRALWERYGRLVEEHAKDKAAETVAEPEAASEKPARKKVSRKRKKKS